MKIDKVEPFLRAMEYAKQVPPPPAKTGSYPFVTISRQTGAGGHSLARALLGEMRKSNDPLFQDWFVFDAEMCQRIFQEAKLYVSFESLVTEEHLSEIEDIMSQLLAQRGPQTDIHYKLFKAIRLLAGFGKAIFVGRGAMCLTQALPAGIHLRLVAPLAVRTRRMMALHQAAEKEARAMIADQDEARAWLVKRYFGKNIEDPLLYHAVWNTHLVPAQEIAGFTLELIKTKDPRSPAAVK